MVKTVSHQKYPIIWFLKPQTICPGMIHSRFPKILLVMVICVFIVYLDRNVDRSFSSAPLRHSFYCLICIVLFFCCSYWYLFIQYPQQNRKWISIDGLSFKTEFLCHKSGFICFIDFYEISWIFEPIKAATADIRKKGQ